MDDKERERILSTIRKLAELANPEHNAFENEIANASAKMQELMDKYNISLLEVMNTSQRSEDLFDQVTCDVILGSVKTWHWAMAHCIDRITQTKHFSTGRFGKSKYGKNVRGASMSFFGAPDSIATAKFLFDKWIVTIDNMAKQETAAYCEHLTFTYGVTNPIKNFRKIMQQSDALLDENDHPNAWRQSWLRGVIAGINAALDEQEKARAAETTFALVKVSEAIELAYTAISVHFTHVSHASGGSTFNRGAYALGHAVGKSLNLTRKELP